MIPTSPLSSSLNTRSQAEFVAALGDIFEGSPWVAERAFQKRPFASPAELHRAMCKVVAAADADAQLELIRAHPDLAGKAAIAGTLTATSSREQAGAGLGNLTEDEYRRFHTLNEAYRAHFGFPFVLAVKGHTKTSILDAYGARLANSPDAERRTALGEIYKIARFRLEALGETL